MAIFSTNTFYSVCFHIDVNPCDMALCSNRYHTCEVEDGQPVCKCERVCPKIYSPVCGSDNKTYSTECMMKMLTCEANKDVTVKHQGKCLG